MTGALVALLAAQAVQCPCGARMEKPCANPNCHLRTGNAPGGGPLFTGAPSLVQRLRDVDEVNALIVRREAADWIERLVRVASASQDLPLWKMEQYGTPRDDYEAVQRLRDALDGLKQWS
ncbi:MAG: hypothetical protein E6J20_18615 [Chloroflexi bacterium]|nr:MAG: hypothetical protein E6J20_18615 [Chloroflexota bacterium]